MLVIKYFLLKLMDLMKMHKEINERVDDNAVIMADFPRCGVGWLRFMIATVLHFRITGEYKKLSFMEMYKYTPTLAGKEKYAPFYFNNNVTLLKTHRDYNHKFKSALIIYRNPFEAIRSYYTLIKMENSKFYLLGYNNLPEEERFLVKATKEYISFHKTWIEQVKKNPDKFLIVKYEDLLVAADKIMPCILDFLKIKYNDLPQNAMVEIASMYQRTEVSKPTMKGKTMEDAIIEKKKLFEKLNPIFCEENLKKVVPDLAKKLMDVYQEFEVTQKKFYSIKKEV